MSNKPGSDATQERFRRKTLPSIITLIDCLVVSGSDSWLWGADFSRAYRKPTVCPLSEPLLGISVQNNYYIDIAPPFGCRTSALACARTTRDVVWLIRQKGFYCLCYLDDFAGVENSRERAIEAYAEFNSLAQELGSCVSIEKM